MTFSVEIEWCKFYFRKTKIFIGIIREINEKESDEIFSGIQEPSKIENIVVRLRDALGRTLEFFEMQFHISASIGIAIYPA